MEALLGMIEDIRPVLVRGSVIIFVCAVLVMAAAFIDMWTGIEAARANKERISSRGLRKTVAKIVDYLRVVMFAAIAVFVLLFYGAVRLAGLFSDDVIGQIMSFLAGLGVAGMLGCGAVITAAAVVISALCSCRIMEKREF